MFSRAQSRAASRGPSRAASTIQGRAMTPMVNAETIESRIQPAVSRQWKKIQEQCRQLDVSGSGEIEVSQFKGQKCIKDPPPATQIKENPIILYCCICRKLESKVANKRLHNFPNISRLKLHCEIGGQYLSFSEAFVVVQDCMSNLSHKF